MQAPPAAPSLARVDRGDLCAGCGACAALAPGRVRMAVSPEGYLRPVQTGPLTPEEDRAVAAVCPGLVHRAAPAAGRPDHPLWGPYVAMHVGHATDAALRFAGASGGGLSGLAAWLLATGRVAGVVQAAADPARPVGNAVRVSRGRDEVLAAAGSRYAPAAPLADLADLLAGEERLAFVGKPCDVAALRALGRRDPRVAARFPVVLSFFCAGTPSLRGGEAVARALGAAPEDLAAFRYRGQGWPGRATATLASGATRDMSYHDSWGGILSKHVQHRCKICADGTGTDADIACADAWQSDADGYPVFEEGEGTSLFVARTEAGAALLAAAEAEGAVALEPFEVRRLAAIQPGQRRRRRALAARLAALRLLGRPVPRYENLGIARAARQAPKGLLARNFLGTLRRGLRRRR